LQLWPKPLASFEKPRRKQREFMTGISVQNAVAVRNVFESIPADGLKRRTVRGGAVTVAAQAACFILQMGSTMVLARLLTPSDYGLMAMVMVLTNALNVFRDGGLSTGTVQKASITHEQVSTLLWVNIGLGCLLGLVTVAAAPVMVRVFHETKLLPITLALATTFPLSALTVQHEALLNRQMRFTALAVIETIAVAVGICVGIITAFNGFGYWALVCMTLAMTLTKVISLALAIRWVPGLPQPRCGVGSLLRFGGYLTGSKLMVYLFRNADNALIGWWWGAGPLGLYSKAYSILMLPINQVNAPMSGVAVPALSRVQNDPERVRRVFLGGYAILASIILPIVLYLTIFTDEVVLVILGEQWRPSISLFRLLAPAALVGALALNPLSWLFIATGRPDRQFRFSILWSGVLVAAFAFGVRFGPAGVAAAYSIISACLALPLCLYAFRGTSIRLGNLANTLKAPAIAALVAALAGISVAITIPNGVPALVRALIGGGVVLAIYSVVLLLVMRQWSFYRDLLTQLLGPKSA
jgi:O-antigen/teichoic acid export membrane protein